MFLWTPLESKLHHTCCPRRPAFSQSDSVAWMKVSTSYGELILGHTLDLLKARRVFMDVKDNVPYLKAWPENVSVPAKRVESTLADTKVSQKSSATGRIASPCSEELAKSLRESGDFSYASCYKLLKSVRFKASKNKRSIITNVSKSPESETEYVVLGAFCHGGMQGITNRSHQKQGAE